MARLAYTGFAFVFLVTAAFAGSDPALQIAYFALMMFSYFVGEVAEHNAEMRKLVACFHEAKSDGKLDIPTEVK